MEDSKRVQIKGRAVPLRGNDIDTDRIIPARFLRCVTFDGLGAHAFEDDRAQAAAAGSPHPFDDARYQGASILLANRNFGCGSSREHAPQALMRWGSGLQAVVAESFAEIFFGNCVVLGIPCLRASQADLDRAMQAVEKDPTLELTVDLATQELRFGSERIAAAIAPGPREQLMSGRWDTTAELLGAQQEITERAATLPYFNFG
jgi:3-isopropylmalate/(R)-2-methylmalate dehydratase small subunit